MISRLSDVLRKNQQTVQVQLYERLSQLGLERDRSVVADDSLPSSWVTLLDTLLDYWEQDREDLLWAWAVQCARESFDAGEASSEVLESLHHAASVMRAYLATCVWRQIPFLQALGQLEESLHLLSRRCLEAYEALLQEQQQRFQEGTSAIMRAGVPEETLKHIVTTAQALSEARYVALHATVETSAVSPFFAKEGDEADVVIGDEPPVWCRSLASQFRNRQAVRFDDLGPLRGDLTGQEAWDGECLGVALPSVSGVVGHLFVVREHYSTQHLKRIETLATYAGAALHTSLMQADMRAQIDQLDTASRQTVFELQRLRPRLPES